MPTVARTLLASCLCAWLSGCAMILGFDEFDDAGADANDSVPDATPACAPPPCPAPTTGFSVCGRLYDLSTSLAVTGLAGEITVEVHDRVVLRQGGNSLLVTAQVDECGYYAATDIPAGLVAVLSDDRVADPGQWTRTTVYVDGLAGQTVSALAFAATVASEQNWSALANQSPGFAAQGAAVMIFVDSSQPTMDPLAGTPAAGVTPVVANFGAIVAHCFVGNSFLDRVTVDSQATSTGQSGSCLVVRTQGGGLLTGLGGGCAWPDAPVPRINDLLHVAVLTAPCQ